MDTEASEVWKAAQNAYGQYVHFLHMYLVGTK